MEAMYHAIYSISVSVSWLQFHVATLKFPSLLVWNSILSAALHVIVMSELKVMWFDRSSWGMRVYMWLLGVGFLLRLLVGTFCLSPMWLLFVSNASRYGLGMRGCCDESCWTRNLCSGLAQWRGCFLL